MIALNYRDTRPMFQQVTDGLRNLMLSGAMDVGEAMPTVRTMASHLAINPNTIQQAYQTLEEEGMIAPDGSGILLVVGGDAGVARQKTILLGGFDTMVAKLLLLGLTQKQLQQRIEEVSQ